MIEIKELCKNFGQLQVLDNVNFTAKSREVVAIIGSSGTGKSTLLRCINYLEQPTSGTINIDGKIINSGKHTEKEIIEFRRKSSMVFQNYNLFKNKTVLQNVMLPLTKVQSIAPLEAEMIAKDLLYKVGLYDKLNEYPSRLSGGQQQRVGIARALAVNPSVILFDEPTSSLDPELVTEVLDIIKIIAKEHNRTILIVTHEMRFAREVADKIVFMDDGIIAEEGSPADLINNSKNEKLRSFLLSDD